MAAKRRARRGPSDSRAAASSAWPGPGGQGGQRRGERHRPHQAQVHRRVGQHGLHRGGEPGVVGDRGQVEGVAHPDDRLPGGAPPASPPPPPPSRAAGSGKVKGPWWSAAATHSKPAFETAPRRRPAERPPPQRHREAQQVLELLEAVGHQHPGLPGQGPGQGVVGGQGRGVRGGGGGPGRGAAPLVPGSPPRRAAGCGRRRRGSGRRRRGGTPPGSRRTPPPPGRPAGSSR